MWTENNKLPLSVLWVVLFLQMSVGVFVLTSEAAVAKGYSPRTTEVLIKGLKIESGEEKLCIGFNLVNGTQFGKKEISGYLFVFGRLGGDAFSYPSGLPFDQRGLDYKKGRVFSILQYKSIRWCIPAQAQDGNPVELVFIAYSGDGVLVMKEEFRFELPAGGKEKSFTEKEAETKKTVSVQEQNKKGKRAARINKLLLERVKIESKEGKLCIGFDLVNSSTDSKKEISGYLFVLGRLGGETFSYPSGLPFDQNSLDYKKGRPFSILQNKLIRKCIPTQAQSTGSVELVFIAYSGDGSVVMKEKFRFEMPAREKGRSIAKKEAGTKKTASQKGRIQKKTGETDRVDNLPESGKKATERSRFASLPKATTSPVPTKKNPKESPLSSDSDKKSPGSEERVVQREMGLPAPVSVDEESGFGSKMTPEELFKYGKLMIQREQLLEANEYLRSVVEKYPESEFYADSLYLLGKNFLSFSKFEEAVSYFDTFIKRFPKDEKATDALLDLGFSLQAFGQFEKAGLVFDMVREKFPGLEGLPSSLLLAMVRAYHRLGDREVFLNVAFQALNLLSGFSEKKEILLVIADDYEKRGRPGDAMKILSSFLFEGTKDNHAGEILVDVADLWNRNPQIDFVPNVLTGGGYFSPREIYLDSAMSYPEGERATEALFKAGRISMKKGDYLEAVHLFKKALRKEEAKEGPMESRFLFHISMDLGKAASRFVEIKGSEGDHSAVLAFYLEEIEDEFRGRLDMKGLIQVGESSRNLGFDDMAIELYKMAMAGIPRINLPRKHLMELGEIYLAQKRWKECLETTLLALKSWKGKDKDSDRRIFEILGEAYFNQGDYKGAIKSMAPHFGRLSPVGKFWLARAYHASGDLNHAENAYREVLSSMKGKGSSQKEKIKTKSRLHLADILFETGRIKEAKLAYQKIIAGRPAVPIESWISYRLASIDLKKEEAEVQETKGSQMDPVWTSAISVVTKIEPVKGGGRSLSR